MSSAYKLNNQGGNIRPWRTPFPIWNNSVVQCPVLTVASWPAHRFLRRQVRWSGIPISWRIFHSLLWSTVKDFGVVNEAEVDVFPHFSILAWRIPWTVHGVTRSQIWLTDFHFQYSIKRGVIKNIKQQEKKEWGFYRHMKISWSQSKTDCFIHDIFYVNLIITIGSIGYIPRVSSQNIKMGTEHITMGK